MRAGDEIRIIDLLAQREAQYLLVKKCEDGIAALLGGAVYPFPPPPEPLPASGRIPKNGWSLQQDKGRNAKARKAQPVARQSSSAAPVLRALDRAAENAYRLVYTDKGNTRISYHYDAAELQSMLAFDCPTFRIVCIETVKLRSLDDFDIIERIYERTAEPTPST